MKEIWAAIIVLEVLLPIFLLVLVFYLCIQTLLEKQGAVVVVAITAPFKINFYRK